MFRLVYSGEGATQPLVDGSSLTKEQKAKAATAEARQCEDADPSCSASTLSNEEYASLLDAAMRFPDKQVGLCVAAMVAATMPDTLLKTKIMHLMRCSGTVSLAVAACSMDVPASLAQVGEV
ncbi:hypothetical protein WJX77_002918 [Trebouxia sp. C0004]